jgi:preprotein translocase subunit SecD
MTKNLRWKVLTILAVAAIATWSFYPPFDAPGRPGKVKLGLDLKGGVHLVLRVQTDDALRLETEMATERLREALGQAGIHGVTLTTATTQSPW